MQTISLRFYEVPINCQVVFFELIQDATLCVAICISI